MLMELPAAVPLSIIADPAVVIVSDSPVVACAMPEPAFEDDEPAYWIDLRYRQHLALRSLEELFESGVLDDLS